MPPHIKMISLIDNHKLFPEQVTCETTASLCLIVSKEDRQRGDQYPQPDLQVGNISKTSSIIVELL